MNKSKFFVWSDAFEMIMSLSEGENFCFMTNSRVGYLCHKFLRH